MTCKYRDGDAVAVAEVGGCDDGSKVATSAEELSSLFGGTGSAFSPSGVGAGTGVSIPMKYVQTEQAFSYSGLWCPHLGQIFTNVVISMHHVFPSSNPPRQQQTVMPMRGADAGVPGSR